MARSTTTTNEYLEDKRADFSKVIVPAYIGASYSSDIHTIGSLRAYEEIPHANKWYVPRRFNNTGEVANSTTGLFSTLRRSGMTYTLPSALRT